MCKFCEKALKKVDVERTTRRGNRIRTTEERLCDPSWKDAEWRTRCGRSEDDYAYMKVGLNVDEKKVTFGYDAYSCDSSFETTLKIKFCPFCGRKL